jgi:hypothetical protein
MLKQYWVLLLLGFILSGCFSATIPQELATVTSPPSPSSTPTVLWFPPTPTNTPKPTQNVTITPDIRSGVGDFLLTDNFSDTAGWSLSSSNRGSAALGINELTIAITQPKGYFFSVREQPTLDNFYAEVTANPYLCLGADEYGMLFRYQSERDFYRFSLSCDGQVRLDRLFDGTAASPQPWMPSTVIPRGAPSESRLGILARGKEMHFFINDQHIFGINDAYLSRGLLGVFARSAGDNAVTVSFSDMVVRQINQ